MHWEKDGYILRPARAGDAQAYYTQNYCPLDAEAARMTGCAPAFTREEIVSFFLHAVDDGTRRFFLLVAPDGRIAGECVINEIDPALRCANYRMAIFHPADRGRGLGLWATQTVRDYAFGSLGLHRLSLDVFSFNPRAEHVYRRAGFRREGVLRDAVRDGDGYGDDILMAMLEDEWRALNGK